MKRRASHSQPRPQCAALLTLLALPALAGAAAGQTDPAGRLDPGYTPDTLALPPASPSVDGAVTEVAAISAPSVPIQGIRFVGTDVPGNVAKASERFLGRPADTQTLQALAAAMTEAYKKSDVALFTLAIPSQDLSDGIVDIYIAEGHIAGVLVVKDAKPVERRRLRGYLEPAMQEKPASRAGFERGIALARRTEGAKVTPHLRTTGEPGGVAVLLDIKEKRFDFAAGFDSRESRLVDSGRVSASATGYSLLRRGDALRGRLSTTPDLEQSRSASLQYKTPIGSNGLDLTLAGAWQETRPSQIDLTGEANFMSASLSYPLILGFRRELTLTGTLDRTENANSALGSIIANELIPAARLGLRGSLASPARSLSGTLTVSQGLDSGNARSSVIGSSLDFLKLGGSVGAVQKIGDSFFIRARGTAQWADDILPANERLQIGGAEFGRGFENGLVSFDNGFAVSIEPAWRPLREGDFKRSELYVFADYADGSVAINAAGTRNLDLSSAGFGTRIAYKDYATIGLEYAEPLTLPVSGMDDDPIFTFSWSLKYRPE